MSEWDTEKVADLLGKTLTAAKVVGGDEVHFTTAEGETYRLYHDQDCCETVKIERCGTDGWYASLEGNEMIVQEATEKIESVPASESATRTTFIINPGKYPCLFIEWLGESNGYYSESVSFVEVK